MTTLAANPAMFTSKFAPAAMMAAAAAAPAVTATTATTTTGTRNVNDDAVNLFVNYLPLTVDDAQLLQRFAAHGRVLSAKIMRHICTDAPRAAALGADAAPVQKSKGYGFVLMASRDEAKSAIDALHGGTWDSKRLVVQVAQRLPADASVPERTQPEAPPVAGRPPTKAASAAPAAAAAAIAPPVVVATAPAATSTVPVTVSPVDDRCTVTRLAAVLEAYGTVTGAEIAPDCKSATVFFTTAASARDAVRWLHGARVPQIAARSVLKVTSPATRAASSRRDGSGNNNRRSGNRNHNNGASRRAELVPTSNMYRVNDRAMPPPPAGLRQMPSLDVPTCDHGPYCQCGEGRALAKQQQHSMPMHGHSDAAVPSARAQLGGSSNGVNNTVAAAPLRHHDPYHHHHHHHAAAPAPAAPAAAPRPLTPPPVSAYHATGACATGCQYCSNGTTVILQNVPAEEVPCERVLNQLLGPIGYFGYWECWGDGQAVATFADCAAAAEAVELLNSTEQQVDFYDCDAGMPASATAGQRY